jgi:hypothetical protein
VKLCSTAGGAAVTVSTAPLPMGRTWSAQLMVVVPGAMPVAKPVVASTVATVASEDVQAICVGVCAEPSEYVAVALNWSVEPAATEAAAADTDMLRRVAAVPVPLSGIDCGDPDASSAIAILAVAPRAADGVKVTLITQLAPAATGLRQLDVCAKLALLAPTMVMLVMFNWASPEFVIVIGFALLTELIGCPENTKDAGSGFAWGLAA